MFDGTLGSLYLTRRCHEAVAAIIREFGPQLEEETGPGLACGDGAVASDRWRHLRSHVYRRYRDLLEARRCRIWCVDERGFLDMDLDPSSDAVVVVDPLGHGSRTGGGLTQLLACSREAGTTIVAVVGDVASHGRAYAATIYGTGAARASLSLAGYGGVTMTVRTVPELPDRVVVTSSEPDPGQRFLPIASPSSSTAPASSLALCRVAAGDADAFVDLDGDLSGEDLLPGRLILEAARGVVTGLTGDDLPSWTPPAVGGIGEPPRRPRPFIAARSRHMARLISGALAHGSPELVAAGEDRYPLVPANLRPVLSTVPVSEKLERAIRRAGLISPRAAVEVDSLAVHRRDVLVKDVARWAKEHQDAWRALPLCPDGSWPAGLNLGDLDLDARNIRWLHASGLERYPRRLATVPMADYVATRGVGVESLVLFGRAFENAANPRSAQASDETRDPDGWCLGGGRDDEFLNRHQRLVTASLSPRFAAVLLARTGIGTGATRVPTLTDVADLLVTEGIDERPVGGSRIGQIQSRASVEVAHRPLDSPDRRWLQARLRKTTWSAEPAVALARYARDGLGAPPSALVPHLIGLMGLDFAYRHAVLERPARIPSN